MNSQDRSAPALRVVFWGTADMSKPRVRILREGLLANDVDLIECRADVWGDVRDKSQIKGAGQWLGMLARMAFAYPALIWRYLRLPKHDWVLLGYPSLPDIFVIRCFAWIRGAKVAMDWFLSAYDTIVCDRGLVGTRSPVAYALRAAEWSAVRIADAPFMDTRTHASRMEALFGLSAGSCGHVWVGVEPKAFGSASDTGESHASSSQTMQVLFYGQFIPLHGLTVIVEAARELREQPIEWLIIGQGQESARIRGMLREDSLPRVRTLDWVDYADLAAYLHRADVCLGIFGTSDKAASVIPNKAFQIIASGKPLVTRDSPAMRELVGEGLSDIALVEAGNPQALADALQSWRANPPRPSPARAELVAGFAPQAIGRQLIALLRERSA